MNFICFHLVSLASLLLVVRTMPEVSSKRSRPR